MIKNEKQYQITSKKLLEFKEAFEKVKENKEINPILQEIQMGALQAQIEIFEDEIKEYLHLKNKKITHIYIDSFSDLHEALIKARISRGWTQFDLAKKLHMKEQQIQRYELGNYSMASIAKINQIVSALDIDIKRIKIKIANFEFTIPAKLENEEVLNGYRKMRENRTLLPV